MKTAFKYSKKLKQIFIVVTRQKYDDNDAMDKIEKMFSEDIIVDMVGVENEELKDDELEVVILGG